MMHITEDTPPDMLAGAMDLTVHLPNGRSVKMSIERSTPMMDLLVQIGTTHNLSLSSHILQALEMAPSAGLSDRILPYKPHTPLGALDTQHIKVVPKNRNFPVPKNVPPGHQPFESTFRLKVHLPRNQLYVTRVSQHVYLEDIMNEVSKEKYLDPQKYEFRHPGNLDEVLDPKLTLSDYQITEIYVVSKGTGRLTQAFSSNDIMALRKEEERKQFQAKTGGGVFSLIFKRGKPSGGTGSLSSDNRSISPAHSDDSRSVTPPSIQPPIIKEPPPDKPKPPQRKRRPAPKPPQAADERRISAEKPASQISNTSETNNSETSSKKGDNSLLICHSRNSSDSSGYHEASILSDNCNTSLPRRPRTMIAAEDVTDSSKLSGEHSRSTGNLAKMSSQSKSTSSLALGRKKKAAPPPPPPVLKTEPAPTKTETASPVVASQPVESQKVATSLTRSCSDIKPVPAPRRSRGSKANVTRAKSMIAERNEADIPYDRRDLMQKFLMEAAEFNKRFAQNKDLMSDCDSSISQRNYFDRDEDQPDVDVRKNDPGGNEESRKLVVDVKPYASGASQEENSDDEYNPTYAAKHEENMDQFEVNSNSSVNQDSLYNVVCELRRDICNSPYRQPEDDCMSESETSLVSVNSKGSTKPKIVDVVVKRHSRTAFDTLTRKRGFKIGESMLNMGNGEDGQTSSTSGASEKGTDVTSLSSKASDADHRQANDYEISGINPEIFKKSLSKKTGRRFKESSAAELAEIHSLDAAIAWPKGGIVEDQSATSLRSIESYPGLMGNMKKWNNFQELDNISMDSSESLRGRNRWVVGDASDTESTSTVPPHTAPESLVSIQPQSSTSNLSSARTSISNVQIPKPEQEPVKEPVPAAQVDAKTATRENAETADVGDAGIESGTSFALSDAKNESDSGICENSTESIGKEDLEEGDWQFQLPSPPKEFRDSTPNANGETEPLDFKAEPVVTNPELYEKLQRVKGARQDSESDGTSVASDEPMPEEICNKLSLENLEKRKTLVYNRELSTSLKSAQVETGFDESSKRSSVLNELEDVITNQKTSTLLRSNAKPQENFKTSYDKNLPNFKISTYDNQKQKINIFEDETVKSSSETKAEPNVSYRRTSGDNLTQKSSYVPAKRNSYNGNTMESVALRKNSAEDVFKKPKEVSKYRPKSTFYEKFSNGLNINVERSGSFSNGNGDWVPSNPVKRSKSQVALNRYKEEKPSKMGSCENLSKSNSLFDVSGLQSLGVIRMIQTKLSSSTDQLEDVQKTAPKAVVPKEQEPHPKTASSENTSTTTIYHNRGPPSINLGTWSQRPKSQVILKEDTDYKFNTVNSKTSTNDATLKNNSNTSKAKASVNSNDYRTVSVKVNGTEAHPPNASNGVSIKVNGSEPKNSGNVIIKIGGSEKPKQVDDVSSRFINHITPDAYRKPLGNVNKIDNPPRPQSFCYDSQPDISRVPIVRSVELKKPFRDLQNKSITHIYSDMGGFKVNDNEPKSLNYSNAQTYDGVLRNENKQSQVYLSNESINKVTSRSSFGPVVKGFRKETNSNRNTWNTYGTLPAKTSQNSSTVTNQKTPFSQSNLRRTESNKIIGGNVNNNNIFGGVVLRRTHVNNNNSFSKVNEDVNLNKVGGNQGPPPPQMPKISHIKPAKRFEPNVDPRDQLLSAIRNFGGKKGLKSTKG